MAKPRPIKNNPQLEALCAGWELCRSHPLFKEVAHQAYLSIVTQASQSIAHLPAQAHAIISSTGTIYARPQPKTTPQQWQFILSHLLLHLIFNHFKDGTKDPIAWQVACDAAAVQFLKDLRIGTPHYDNGWPDFPARQEEQLYNYLQGKPIPEQLQGLGSTPFPLPDFIQSSQPTYISYRYKDWAQLFNDSLQQALLETLASAAGKVPGQETIIQQSRSWFISNFPLLGGVASHFKVIEDIAICRRLQIEVAAIDSSQGIIYANPAAGLTLDQWRFVMAHEFLHAGLSHWARCKGRDPYWWNVACDYIINHWLVQMKIGTPPGRGFLYDPSLPNTSAEALYDHIIRNIRNFRRLRTLRGEDLGDMLPSTTGVGELDGTSLDQLYRNALAQGLNIHKTYVSRGFLPNDLIEEITALEAPSIPWDVKFGYWFSEHFPLPEKRRTYAKLSRRQSATPDIARPRYVNNLEEREGRVFGVLLDTSGSASTKFIATCLGTLAQYGISHEVTSIRLITCDAAATDRGYIEPNALLAQPLTVKGRGGTVLQPGLDMLEAAEDFPKDAPILVITDGECDKLNLAPNRDYAFLLNPHRFLPFGTHHPIFQVDTF